jgi:hypothetical protein
VKPATVQRFPLNLEWARTAFASGKYHEAQLTAESAFGPEVVES